MKALGIDPSTTSTGWAVLQSEKTALSVIEYGVIQPKSKMKAGEKLKYIFNGLNEIHERHKDIDIVSLEDQYFRFVNATKAVLRVRGVSELFAALHGIDCVVINAKTLKLLFSGYGGGKKEKVIKAVKSKYGIEVRKDDEADAIALAETAIKQYFEGEKKWRYLKMKQG